MVGHIYGLDRLPPFALGVVFTGLESDTAVRWSLSRPPNPILPPCHGTDSHIRPHAGPTESRHQVIDCWAVQCAEWQLERAKADKPSPSPCSQLKEQQNS